MYKKCALFLVLMVSAHLFSTTGAAESTAEATDSSAIQALFSEAAPSCAGRLSATDISSPSLLQTFYAELAYQPQWASIARREKLQEQINGLLDDGLNPAHYQLPADYQGLCDELVISQSYLRALSHLSRGKVEQDRVDRFWREPSSEPLQRPSVLSIAWAGLADLPQAFNQARPQQPQYQRLRAAYQTLRNNPQPAWPRIAAGPLLKPNQSDPRVAALWERLAAEGYLAPESQASTTLYDAQLVNAVKDFQRQHHLQSDGVVGPATLAALNVSPQQRLDQVKANLERWRWLENDIEPTSLLVDIVGGYLTYYQDGVPIWQTRAQVGRPRRQTPRLKSHVNRLSLNPTWTVPPTILRQDKLPAIRRDPDYLARNDMRVLDSQGRTLDPDQVDWYHPGNIMLRQAAGPNNPLGKLVIRFPNPFSVYLHDTPSQHLFSQAARTFSSGCVRIEGIQQLLPLILSPEQSQSVSARIASGRTSEVNYSERLPLVMAYWTAEVNEAGQLQLRSDPYNLDPALLRALESAP